MKNTSEALLTSAALDGDRDGIELIDSIERRRVQLYTESAVTPHQIAPDSFPYPVDHAVKIRTSAITLSSVVGINVREEGVIARIEEFAEETFPSGSYVLELSESIKLYLSIESAVRISTSTAETRIEFGGETSITVGARSRHQSPAVTVTTTEDPTDMMAAISTFSSALKTTTVDRSYPTLRGHPPAIKVGEKPVIPPELNPPDTGVTIEIPPALEYVFVIPSLAYYLGATVVPGTVPRILTETGFEHQLETESGFEHEVERVLKRVFFLDCLTRTAGDDGIELHEQRSLDGLGLSFDTLYGQSIPEQLEAYLSVPFEEIESVVPTWKVTSHVSPSWDSIESIPFLVNDLAVIKTPRSRSESDLPSHERQTEAIAEFVRDGALTRSAASEQLDRKYVQLSSEDSLEQVWVGEETPVGASKATPTAFRNRLQRSPTDGDITITVVCNESEMIEERDAIDSVYGSRTQLPFDVRTHRELTTEELARVLEKPTDFFHYIGHISTDGFQCHDGLFDARMIESVGVDAFFLNACQSYEQGMALIDAGAIGGAVTLANVINDGALRIGRTMARLLNRGFPLRAAMNIASGESIIGNQYLVVGDGGLAITQPETGVPTLAEIVPTGGDQFEVTLHMYPTHQFGMGSVSRPFVDGEDKYHLASGGIETYELTKSELKRFLDLERIPVAVAGNIHWSDDVSLDEI